MRRVPPFGRVDSWGLERVESVVRKDGEVEVEVEEEELASWGVVLERGVKPGRWMREGPLMSGGGG